MRTFGLSSDWHIARQAGHSDVGPAKKINQNQELTAAVKGNVLSSLPDSGAWNASNVSRPKYEIHITMNHISSLVKSGGF